MSTKPKEPTKKAGADKVRQKYAQIRKRHFSSDIKIWNAAEEKHYTPIPRILPLILRLMNELAGSGMTVSSVYLSIWCRHWNTGLVISPGEDVLAFAAGFSGQRARDTWRKRMGILKKLGFLETARGVTGDHHYILIPHPVDAAHRACSEEEDLPTSAKDTYEALITELAGQ